MPISPFFVPPQSRDFWLADVRLAACTVADGLAGGGADAEGLFRGDLRITNGRIAAVAPLGTAPKAPKRLAGNLVLPCFVDLHTHLDKGQIWPRAKNPDGSFLGAVEAVIKDRARTWNRADVERRFDFALRAAYAHGTAALRTHIDTNPENAETSWAVFRAMRKAWRGRIELQASSIMAQHFFTPAWAPKAADLVAKSGGVLGVVLRADRRDGLRAAEAAIEKSVNLLFKVASERRLDLDLHVDETGEAGASALLAVARKAVKSRFKGKIVAGHCCSLALERDEDVERTIAAVKDAGMTVVSLPMCNMYLQDRKKRRTPRWRGVTLLHELRAAGVPVALASDNTRDPFYAYGDLDMVEVYREATRIAHLDHPIGDWPRAIGAAPANAMGLSGRGRIAIGAPADLAIFKARSFSEFLSRPQADRAVLRAGRAIDTSPPDYAELDDLFER